jgi:hypothetical protein
MALRISVIGYGVGQDVRGDGPCLDRGRVCVASVFIAGVLFDLFGAPIGHR